MDSLPSVCEDEYNLPHVISSTAWQAIVKCFWYSYGHLKKCLEQFILYVAYYIYFFFKNCGTGLRFCVFCSCYGSFLPLVQQGYYTSTHRNGNVDILTNFSSLAVSEVVQMTTSGTAYDEIHVKMTFMFQYRDNRILARWQWNTLKDMGECITCGTKNFDVKKQPTTKTHAYSMVLFIILLTDHRLSGFRITALLEWNTMSLLHLIITNIVLIQSTRLLMDNIIRAGCISHLCLIFSW